jgi:polyribonucleotide nucleotidyltransferase
MKILDFMNGVLSKPRERVSEYAPKVVTLRIDPSKVGEVIGPGGRVIRSIIGQTETKIDIDDETGTVFIYGKSYESVQKAKDMIEEITADLEVGKTYMGEVYRIEPYGVFVRIGKKEALLHISEYDFKRTTPEELRKQVKIGDKILVKVIDVDVLGRVKVSRKQAMRGVSKLSRGPRKNDNRGRRRD